MIMPETIQDLLSLVFVGHPFKRSDAKALWLAF